MQLSTINLALSSVSGLGQGKLLENAAINAVASSGGSMWYVPDDFLVLGPELSPNPGNPFIDTTGITAFTSGVLSVVNGMLRSGTADGGYQPMIANFAIQTTPGKNYKVSVPSALKTSQVGVFNLQVSNNSNGSGSFASVTYGAFGSAATGLMEYVFTATATTTYVGLRADNGVSGTSSDYSEWGGCSVREVLSAKDWQDSAGTLPSYLSGPVGKVSELVGINSVTQATAANRPTITRIPRKLGPELVVNGDFSSGASSWSTNGSTVNTSAGDCAVTVSTTTGRIEQSVSGKIQAGKTYSVTANIKPGSDISSRLNVIRSVTGGYATIAVAPVVPATTNAINSVVFTAPADDAIVQVVNASGLTSGTFICDNISVREVFEWSYALTVDGTNDSLAAPASIIGPNLSQPYTMIAWGKMAQANVGQRIAGDTARWVSIGSTNKLVITHQGASAVVGVSDVAIGELFVYEATWDGSTAKIFKNGVLDGQLALDAPSGVTPSATNIGQNGAAASYFKGDIGGVLVCPVIMSDAQRKAVRDFAAYQMGLTL